MIRMYRVYGNVRVLFDQPSYRYGVETVSRDYKDLGAAIEAHGMPDNEWFWEEELLEQKRQASREPRIL